MIADPLVLEARALAEGILAPRAEESDRAAAPPRANIAALAAAGLLGLTVPAPFGGRGADAATVRHVLEEIAAGCGLTAFCAFQHLVAARHVASSDNDGLKARVLPALANGTRVATVAFSHLRRPGPPCLRAAPAPGGGYVLEGTAPWATGIGLADDVLIAATLGDGRSIWAYLPLDRGGFDHTPPLPLLCMNASGTVSLRCNALPVRPDEVVKQLHPEALARDTAYAALFFSALSLGATGAAIRVLRQQAAAMVTSGEPLVTMAAARFAAALDEARAAVDMQAERPLNGEVEAAWYETRAACIDLGLRAAHAALAACGGGATTLDHPAQRILREAALYTTTAQSSLLRAATLARLTADLPPG